MSKNITQTQVKHIADLANIPIKDAEADSLAEAFDETLEVVNQLQQVDTSGVEETHQVTGLENVLREDEVDTERMFSQSQALANASKTHDGYFVVPRLIHK